MARFFGIQRREARNNNIETKLLLQTNELDHETLKEEVVEEVMSAEGGELKKC